MVSRRTISLRQWAGGNIAMIMEAMYLISRTALSKSVRNIVVFLFCLNACSVVLDAAEVLTGAVVLDDSGEGPRSVGTVRLATATGIYNLDYSEPLDRRFATETCWDIGAIWSVEVELVDSSREITKVRCAGRVDEVAHGTWLVVRDYLQAIGDDRLPSPALLSSRWSSSPDFQEYRSKAKGLDGSALRFHGRPGRCVEVTKVERNRAQLRSDNCFLKLSGKYVSLTFDVVRNSKNSRWEIDGIRIN